MKIVKKMIYIALAALILCLGCICPSAADASFTIDVSASRSTVTPGNYVTITLLAEDITAEGGLLSLDIPFRFDTEVFDYIGAEPIYPEEWTEPADFSYSTPREDGLVWLRIVNDYAGFTSEYGCAADGKIGFAVTLRVKMTAAAGTTVVNINGDGGFLVIVGTCADGNCTAAYGYAPSLTLEVGEFAGIIGDVNDDGVADSADASLILRYDVGLLGYEEYNFSLGDVDGNGRCDNADASMVLRYDAGLLEHF